MQIAERKMGGHGRVTEGGDCGDGGGGGAAAMKRALLISAIVAIRPIH